MLSFMRLKDIADEAINLRTHCMLIDFLFGHFGGRCQTYTHKVNSIFEMHS